MSNRAKNSADRRQGVVAKDACHDGEGEYFDEEYERWLDSQDELDILHMMSNNDD